jgi:predicted nucleic acid-binding protein
MPLNYTVKAQVVDIRTDTPKKDDKFLVDSNVWYWCGYTNASISSRPYQVTDYPDYLWKALSAGSSLSYCGLSLAELAHQIEEQERNIFNPALKPKEYRHNELTERPNLFAQIKRVWAIVKSKAICADIPVNEAKTDAALARFETQFLDGYDLLILEAMEKANIAQVITDDGDYVTVPGIKVFTANKSVIAAARNHVPCMLVTR